MDKLLKRIKNKCGETLLESVVSILIFTFASIIMFTMITSANRINSTAKENDREHYEQLVVAELAPKGSGIPQDISFTIDGKTFTERVEVFGTDGGLYAYYKQSAGGAAG